MRFLQPAFISPESAEVQGRPEFERLCPLTTNHFDGLTEGCFGFGTVIDRIRAEQFPSEPVQFGFPPTLVRFPDIGECIVKRL